MRPLMGEMLMVTTPERQYAGQTVVSRTDIDQGLRAYMLRVFGLMGAGLAVTGLVALFVANSPAMLGVLYGTPLRWVVIFAPVVLAFIFGMRIQSMSAGAAQALFWVFAGAMGLSLASIFIIYTGESVARTFFIAAGTFAATALYGYTTKRDLTGMGSFLLMGVIGLIIASLVNIFLASSALQWTISILGVLIFTGLTAYDSQKIKEMYWAGDSAEIGTKKAVMGALNLYMDFINLFLFMLQFFGDRR
jgi:FtsH-binding integral membrane protein